MGQFFGIPFLIIFIICIIVICIIAGYGAVLKRKYGEEEKVDVPPVPPIPSARGASAPEYGVYPGMIRDDRYYETLYRTEPEPSHGRPGGYGYDYGYGEYGRPLAGAPADASQYSYDIIPDEEEPELMDETMDMPEVGPVGIAGLKQEFGDDTTAAELTGIDISGGVERGDGALEDLTDEELDMLVHPDELVSEDLLIEPEEPVTIDGIDEEMTDSELDDELEAEAEDDEEYEEEDEEEDEESSEDSDTSDETELSDIEIDEDFEFIEEEEDEE